MGYILLWIFIGLIYGCIKTGLMDEIICEEKDMNDPEVIVLLLVLFPIVVIFGLIYFIHRGLFGK